MNAEPGIGQAAGEPGAHSDGEAPVQVSCRDGVGWVTLSRPRALNAMNGSLMDQLRDHLEALAVDPEVRCVVLRGAGRAFSAGGDVKMSHERANGAAGSVGARMERERQQLARRSQSSVLLYTMPKPTVALLHGHVVGGGMSLALAADLRLAAVSTQLRVGFATRALSGDFGISFLLEKIVGTAQARELLMLDPVLDAAEAARRGLITTVYPDDELTAAGEELAARLAAGPTVAFSRMKSNLAVAQTSDFAAAIEIESANQRFAAATADASASARAFVQGSAPEAERD
jgi:2-(1,2-epoxy-1,2-dihydrophenyl)acetyl-CoA isomerase